MKQIYLFLLVLLCSTGMLAQETEREYVSLLREDLVWVGTDGYGLYYLCVQGDSVVDGVTYKKIYRHGLYSFSYSTPIEPYTTLNPYCRRDRPVGCLREENGRVFRLCTRGGYFSSDLDVYSLKFTDNYPIVVNETATHYEVMIYDFNSPNVYNGSYFTPCPDVEIGGEKLRVYAEKDQSGFSFNIMVEGYGMIARHQGKKSGGDLIAPFRRKGSARDGADIWFGVYYVRDLKGNVLLFDDHFHDRVVGINPIYYEEDYDWIIPSDPYDINNDGTFDIGDINLLINVILGKQSSVTLHTLADLNFDQSVDIEDLNMYIHRMLSGVKAVTVSSLVTPEAE